MWSLLSLLLLSAPAWSQSTAPAKSLLQDTRIDAMDISIRELQSGKPTITGAPTYLNGATFTGTLTANGALNAAGATSLAGANTINGTATFGSSTTFNGLVLGSQIIAAAGYFNGAGSQNPPSFAVNVTSVSRVTTGVYNINLSLAMANTFYAVLVNGEHSGADNFCNMGPSGAACAAKSTTAFCLRCYQNTSTTGVDVDRIMFAVIGTR